MCFSSEPTRPVKRLTKKPHFVVHWRGYSVTRRRFISRFTNWIRATVRPLLMANGGRRKEVCFKNARRPAYQWVAFCGQHQRFRGIFDFITLPSSIKPKLMMSKVGPAHWTTHPFPHTPKWWVMWRMVKLREIWSHLHMQSKRWQNRLWRFH